MAFDDDDTPSPVARPLGDDAAASAEEAMEDEGMPDYKLFASMFDKRGVSAKTIRRGEKDFEAHGTRAQDGVLESSRRALEEVLGYTRTHREDTWVRGWYAPDFWCAAASDSDVTAAASGGTEPPSSSLSDSTRHDSRHRGGSGDDDGRLMLRQRVVVVEHERGSWNRDIGRSVPTAGGGSTVEAQRPGLGRLWLLPEEVLHLVERGTLDLWWPFRDVGGLLLASAPSGEGGEERGGGGGPDCYDDGVPLSLEAAYSLLIGEDGERGKVSLPRYQVFAHLKRGGFHVLRAPEPHHQVVRPGAETTGTAEDGSAGSLWRWLLTLAGWDGESADDDKQKQPRNHSFGPMVLPGLYRAYKPIYEQLSLTARHKPRDTPVTTCTATAAAAAVPTDPYKVFFHVWKAGAGGSFSKRRPPAPDFRIAVSDAGSDSLPTLEEMSSLLESTPLDRPPRLESRGGREGPGRVYRRLKHGHRNVLVAVVDRGLVNFMRFGEGAFGEERLYERHDERRPGRGGGAKWGGGRGRGGRGRGGRGRGRR